MRNGKRLALITKNSILIHDVLNRDKLSARVALASVQYLSLDPVGYYF